MKKKLVVGIIAGLCIIYGIIFFSISIIPEKDNVQLLLGDYDFSYPSYQAHLFGKSIQEDIVVEDTIDYYHTGTYEITYSYQPVFFLKKVVRVPVAIMDVDSPVINLPSGAVYFVKTGSSFEVPSFSVEDEYDQEDDIAVSVTGEVDTNQSGEYVLQIQACDASENCSMKSLYVEVGEMGEEDFLPSSFQLSHYDDKQTILTIREEYIPDDEYEQVYLVGDSNYLNLAKEGGYPAERVLGRFALSPNTFSLPVTYNNEETESSVLELLEQIQPACILLDMGLAQSVNGNPIEMSRQYQNCILEIQKTCPNTKIIISSLFPISEAENEVHVTQTEVNKTNYYLLKMCEEMNLSMFEVPSYLFGEDGYANMEFFREDGYHLRGEYYDLFTDHMRSYLRIEGKTQ